MRKSLLAALMAFAALSWAAPAHAFVAQVATSLPADSIGNEERLDQAIQAALVDVLKSIAVQPSVLQLQKAQLVGDRIYLLFLVADVEGEQMLKVFTRGAPLDSPPEE